MERIQKPVGEEPNLRIIDPQSRIHLIYTEAFEIHAAGLVISSKPLIDIVPLIVVKHVEIIGLYSIVLLDDPFMFCRYG